MARSQQAHATSARVLAAMLMFSAACLLLHLIRPSWGAAIDNRLGQLAQPVALLAGLTNRAAPVPSSLADDPAARSSLQRDMTEGQFLALAEEVQSLRERNAELMGLRAHSYIPPRLGRLMPARVISRDSLAYRSVETINRGADGGATAGQFVTSAVYLDRGQEDGLNLKRNIFSVESLVGQVMWVGPYTSRVRLLTDPTSQIPVRIARLHPDQPKEPVGLSLEAYTLEGAGSAGMLIRHVNYRLTMSGAIKVGDLVVAEPSADLPREAASLRRVGRITDIKRGSTQYDCTLVVTPLIDMSRLGHVYVFDPTPVE